MSLLFIGYLLYRVFLTTVTQNHLARRRHFWDIIPLKLYMYVRILYTYIYIYIYIFVSFSFVTTLQLFLWFDVWAGNSSFPVSALHHDERVAKARDRERGRERTRERGLFTRHNPRAFWVACSGRKEQERRGCKPKSFGKSWEPSREPG